MKGLVLEMCSLFCAPLFLESALICLFLSNSFARRAFILVGKGLTATGLHPAMNREMEGKKRSTMGSIHYLGNVSLELRD